MLAAALCAAGCRRGDIAPESAEVAYVSGASAELRDELGPSSKVIAHFESGERVEVLSRRPRWAEVRRSGGESGWVLQRSLVGQDIFDQFAKLARQCDVLPSQGSGTVRHDANLHIAPGRATQVFYQLAEGEQVESVGHRLIDRDAPAAPSAASDDASGSENTSSASAPLKNPEDWLLVRASRDRAGWLLESSVDLTPPIEISQYSEGLRIRAWFEIYRETDAGQPHPWYLWATVRKLNTVPYDFDEIRVFVWDPKSSRYETAYRERNLAGVFPITVGTQDSAAGPAPTFQFTIRDATGQSVARKYYMLGRQVRLQGRS